jgi:hypothetical protein
MNDSPYAAIEGDSLRRSRRILNAHLPARRGGLFEPEGVQPFTRRPRRSAPSTQQDAGPEHSVGGEGQGPRSGPQAHLERDSCGARAGPTALGNRARSPSPFARLSLGLRRYSPGALEDAGFEDIHVASGASTVERPVSASGSRDLAHLLHRPPSRRDAFAHGDARRPALVGGSGGRGLAVGLAHDDQAPVTLADDASRCDDRPDNECTHVGVGRALSPSPQPFVQCEWHRPLPVAGQRGFPQDSTPFHTPDTSFFTKACAAGGVDVPDPCSATCQELLRRHCLEDPVSLAEDLGVSLQEVHAAIRWLGNLRHEQQAASAAIISRLPDFPAYVLAAIIVAARVLGDVDDDSLAAQCARAHNVSVSQPLEVGQAACRSFHQACDTLRLPGPPNDNIYATAALMGISRGDKTRVEWTELAFGIYWLEWLGDQDELTTQAAWSSLSDEQVAIILGAVRTSFHHGRRGARSLWAASFRAQSRILNRAITTPLLVRHEPPAPVRFFPFRDEMQANSWLDFPEDPSRVAYNFTLSESICIVRNFREASHSHGPSPRLTLDARRRPVIRLAPNNSRTSKPADCAAELHALGLDWRSFMPGIYFARSPDNTQRVYTAAHLWMATRDIAAWCPARSAILSNLRWELLRSVLCTHLAARIEAPLHAYAALCERQELGTLHLVQSVTFARERPHIDPRGDP